jgi:rhodanese-related sulfurtransferase
VSLQDRAGLASDVMELTPQEAADRVEAGEADLVDVREPYEWDAGHIEGARHVPLPELAEFAQTLDPARPVVFVCRVGGRSAMATDAFRQAGFEAYNLGGGMVGWARARLPFTGIVAEH